MIALFPCRYEKALSELPVGAVRRTRIKHLRRNLDIRASILRRLDLC